MRLVNLVGKKYGKLTVLSRNGSDGTGHPIWNCVCQCGNRIDVLGADLKRGQTKTCGCGRVMNALEHGLSKTPEYGIWRGMIERCTNPLCKSFKNYGGRGIKVCERWNSVAVFISDMGPRPFQNAEIDRIDVNGNYEPSNCRWTTRRDNSLNKRNNVRVEFLGVDLCCSQWDAIKGFPPGTVANRIKAGWNTERALTQQVCSGKRIRKTDPRY